MEKHEGGKASVRQGGLALVAGPGERRRGLLVAVLVAAPARERGGVACSLLSSSLGKATPCFLRCLSSVSRPNRSLRQSDSLLDIQSAFAALRRWPCVPVGSLSGSLGSQWIRGIWKGLYVHNMYRNTAKPSIELKPREVLILGMMPYDRSAQVLPRLLPGCAAIARAWPCPQLPRCRRSLLFEARPLWLRGRPSGVFQ